MRVLSLMVATCVLAFSVSCSQSDAGVTTSVKTRLAADDTVKALKIDVDTKDRVVTLTGEVRTSQEETKALEIARATKGVADVVDHLSIVPEAGPASAPTTGRVPGEPAFEPMATDPSLTAEVKVRSLADPVVKGLKIDVDTKDRVVTLKGAVDTQAEKDRAVTIAREVNNVARVNDQLTVRKQ